MFLANGVYVFSVPVCHSQKTPHDCYLSMLDVQMGNAKNKRCIVKRNKEELMKGKQQDLIGKKPNHTVWQLMLQHSFSLYCQFINIGLVYSVPW